LLICHFINGRILRRPNTVIAYNDINFAEILNRCVDQRLSRLGRREISLDRDALFFPTALPAQVVRYFACLLIVKDDARSSLREHPYYRCADSARAAGNNGNAAFQREDNPFSRHGKYDTEQQAISARPASAKDCADSIRAPNQ
jgi:hypothetical protein